MTARTADHRVILHNREAGDTQFKRKPHSRRPSSGTPRQVCLANAQPIARPDSSFSQSPSACFACIFLYLRSKSSFATLPTANEEHA
jgi:hypothetical protein